MFASQAHPDITDPATDPPSVAWLDGGLEIRPHAETPEHPRR